MSVFKVGDEVKCVRGRFCGEIGVVQSILKSAELVVIFTDRNYGSPVVPTEIRKLTKLEKALK